MKRKHQVIEDLDIIAYAAEGKSVGKLEGKVVFVEGVVPGDVVDVVLKKNKKNWAEGIVKDLKKSSQDRVVPFCKHFGICGGCKWQMLDYGKQLEYKQAEAEETIKRIGRLQSFESLAIKGSVKTIYYRNKLEFTFSDRKFLTEKEFRELGDNAWPGAALGYHVPRLYDKVLDIQECWLMDDVNNVIRNGLRDYALKNEISFYNIQAHLGFLRNLIIRTTIEGECMVNLVVAEKNNDLIQQVCNFLVSNFPQITTLLFTINTKWNDTIYDLDPVVVKGRGYITEKLGRFSFKISPKSFFQTNSLQAKVLYDVVKDFADLKGSETVYDLYCGTGSIGIYLSDFAGKIVGVDAVAEAIEDAKENARMNGLRNATFYSGDVIDVCGDTFFSKNGDPDIIIVDPPRAGLHQKLIDKLIETAAPRIVYISCNVATQARDIELLKEHYAVEKIQPVDMFPHTHHLECVALLRFIK